ncbi:MAG: tyrosine-type recombinase/integrase [Chloroflexi bacterium]|nr:tyrosine-type recombinase/integrase [Chloroflexota bacterium]
MFQARNGTQIFGLPGNNGLSVPAVAPENPDSGREVTERLPQLLELYARNHFVEGSTEATIKFYRKEVGLFLKFLESLGHSMVPGEVSRDDVLNHLADLKERGRRPRTIRTRRQAVLSFFDWAKEWGKVEKNPVDGIKAPKVPKRPKPFLKRESFLKLLDLCPINTFLGARRQTMLFVLLGSGMRLNELRHLTLDDLDWDGSRVRVVYGKGQKQRWAPFPKQAQVPMLRYLDLRTDDLPSLWVTEERKRMGYDGFGQDIRRLMERAGIIGEIEDAVHIFRRTFAVTAVDAGVPRELTESMAGWSDTRMLKHYIADYEDDQGKAIESFQENDPLGRWLDL